MFMYFMIDI